MTESMFDSEIIFSVVTSFDFYFHALYLRASYDSSVSIVTRLQPG